MPTETAKARARGLTGRRFPADAGARLRAALAAEHRRHPFSPDDPRDAARRVLGAAEELGLHGHIERGGVDVGGAELDHLWTVVERRIVDVVLPLRAERFVSLVRGYVAGDIDPMTLTDAAADYAIEWRVIGDVPTGCRYLGAPILTHRAAALS